MNRRGFWPRMGFTTYHTRLTTGGREMKRAWREMPLATRHTHAVATYRNIFTTLYTTMGIMPKLVNMWQIPLFYMH